jgi:hypothetical protein
MRAEDDKLMKFQRAAEFMRVPPDLTTATLYKYPVSVFVAWAAIDTTQHMLIWILHYSISITKSCDLPIR